MQTQACRGSEWVLVDDAGERGTVDEVVRQGMEASLEARAIHRGTSAGIEAATKH